MESIQYIDILLFAMIAAFLVFRLRSVLGRRDGNENTGHRDPFRAQPQDDQSDDNVIPLPERETSVERAEPEALDMGDGDDPLSAGLIQIRVADPSFQPDEFVVGARVAFEMILTAFAKGDLDILEPLLEPTVFGNFSEAIRLREANDETVEDTLVGFKTSDLMEAYMEGRVAHVTIKFVSEQVNVTRDAEGQVLDGNPNEVITVTDFWTFARDTKSKDPNWQLVATHSAE